MSQKNEQIKKLIEQMVQKEVRRILPEVVKQVMTGMIMESTVSLPPSIDNSHKRRSLQEASGNGYEPYPDVQGRPVFDRRSMAADDFGTIGGEYTAPVAHQGMITAPAITDQGTPVPVDPRQIPDHVLNAFNRDYSGLMKSMDIKKNG